MIIDFGKVKWKEYKSISVKIGSESNPVVHAHGSCGCLNVSLKENVLTVGYNAGKIPKHFKVYGITARKINNHVTIKYQNGAYEKIILKGFVE